MSGKDKGAEYKNFLETCLGGSVDDTDAHDKLVLGPGLKDAIGEIPEDKEDKEDKDSDSKDDDQKNTTVCFNLNDSENESSSFGDDDDDDEWDLEDAYNFDAEKIAELLQKGGDINEEELVESMQESMAEAMLLRMNVDDPDLEAERPDCSGTLDGRMTPPAKDAKDFDAATPPDPKVLAEKLETKGRRRSSISGRQNINDAVKTTTARTRKSIACVAAEKTASGADKATIELAAGNTNRRHRMSLCKAAETLDMAGLGDDDPEEVKKKVKIFSKCLMVARGRHRMNVAAAVKKTICGESDEETETAVSEKTEEAKSSKDGSSKEASAPKATPKPKFMSKLRACAKEFKPSEKQLSIQQKIDAAVQAAYKRNGPVEKPEKSEVKEEWTTAYEDMSLYGYEDYSWQGQYGYDGSYGYQMNCNQMGCNQMGYNQMNQMAYNQMQYQQTGYNQMACGGGAMGCQGCNQWQGSQWQSQAGWNGNDGQYDSYGNYVGPGNYGNDYNNCYYNNYGQAQNNGYGGNWQNAAWGSA